MRYLKSRKIAGWIEIYSGWLWTNISSWIINTINWFLISVIWLYEKCLVSLEIDSEVSMYGFGFLTLDFLAWFFFLWNNWFSEVEYFLIPNQNHLDWWCDGFLYYLYSGWIYDFNEDSMRNNFMIWIEINLMALELRSRATCVTIRICGNSIFSLPNNLNLFY